MSLLPSKRLGGLVAPPADHMPRGGLVGALPQRSATRGHVRTAEVATSALRGGGDSANGDFLDDGWGVVAVAPAGGSAATAAAAKAARLLEAGRVKQLMEHQRAAEDELAAMKRKATGRQVLEAKTHSRMRIISGSAAGRQLASSKGSMTRPMMEKASPLLHDRSIVFVEYPMQLAHQVPATLGPLATVRDRRYGRTWIRVYGPADGPVAMYDEEEGEEGPEAGEEDEMLI
eukprot:XP_001693434.1 predicted protein [Chlamydomonas reinhardtii]